MKRLAVPIRLPLALSLGVLAFLALLWLLGRGPSVIQAQGPDGYSTYHVAPSCAGVPAPCYTSVQAAVDAADDPDDVIKVAAGTYTGVQGRPFPPDYLSPPAGGLVTQVVYISKTVTIRGGYTTDFAAPPDPEANPTSLDAEGQGRVMLIGGTISPTVEGLHLTGGDSTGLGGSSWDYYDTGGGVYVISATVTIRDSKIFSNTAYGGGGLYLYASDARFSSNAVFLNTADGVGGGLSLLDSAGVITGNSVFSNTAHSGGGLLLSSSPATVSGNVVSGNIANGVDFAQGGGLVLYSSDATIHDNIIYGNHAPIGDGGGLYLSSSAAILSGNNVSTNTALYGGGLHLYQSPATLSDSVVFDNEASADGGGLCLVYSDATLIRNTVISNTSKALRGGGLFLAYSAATLTGNIVASNISETDYGGGLYVILSDPELVNNVIVDNAGSGLEVSSSSFPRLLHNTVARNGIGIKVTGSEEDNSTVALTNTILVSNSTGIYVIETSLATLEGTLWGSGAWSNGADWGGLGTIFTGTVNVWGDPDFIDPDYGDYHIGPESAARDAGVDAGVTTDIDGEMRPAGAGYDIGADEYYSVTNSPPNEPSDPVPADGAIDQGVNVDLYWTGGDPDGDSVTYDVYFEANDPTPADLICDDVATLACDPGTLAYDTHYYWYVAASDEHGATTVGATWGFHTEPEPNHPPQLPQDPSPVDGATQVPLTATLSWQGGDPDGDVVTYTVAFGTDDPPPYAATTGQTQYAPALKANSTYYWSITASDGVEVSAGPVWRFSTLEEFLIYLPLVLRGYP